MSPWREGRLSAMKKGGLWPLLAGAVGLGLLLAANSAAAEGELTVDVASVDDGAVPEVRAVVTVLDAGGRPLSGLTAEDFQASVNGEGVPVADVRAAVNSDIGVAVTITVDVSGSMQGAPIEQARAAAKAFVESLAPIDSAAILTFSDAVTTLQDFTSDRTPLLAAIDGLKAVGNTALYQAASVAAGQAASSTSQRKAIILLSDGVDYGGKSAVSRGDSIAQANQLGVPVFAVGLGSGIDREYLTELAEATGGRFLETPTPEGLNDLFRTIGDFLRSQYVVTVNVEALDRSQPLLFELEVRSGQLSGRGSLQVAPREEAAPEPPSVILTGLSADAQVQDPVSLQAQVTGGADLKSVAFLVDGQEVYTFTAPPFQLRLDPQAYGGGGHLLRVEAQDARGSLGTSDVPFTTIVPTPSKSPPTALLLLGVVAVVLVGAVIFVFLRARRRDYSPSAIPETQSLPRMGRRRREEEGFEWSRLEPVRTEDRALGRLILITGPRAGEAFPVGEHPRRIGAASYCDIILDDERDQGTPEEARVWVSDGRLMCHNFRRLSSMAVDGPTGGWLILDHGDELQIGQYRLIFELAGPDDCQPEPVQTQQGTAEHASRPER